MASVVNMRHRPDLHALLDGADEHGDTVRIDRKSRWGNPFRLGRHGRQGRGHRALPRLHARNVAVVLGIDMRHPA